MGDPWKSISPEGVRAFTYGSLSVLLIWAFTENYLSFVNNSLIMIGMSSLLAQSFMISTFVAVLIIFIMYGLHGKLPTTLMLQHMPWVKNPDRFLFFFYVWINLIAAGLLNVLDLNKLYYFMSLFFIFLLPSLILGLRIQKKGGNI